MSPRKRKSDSSAELGAKSNKRLSKAIREKLVCKGKLEELEQAEALKIDDRFSSQEKECLLKAYNMHGFHVFQDMKLLHEFLPNRRECDLRGLLDRLQNNLQDPSTRTQEISGSVQTNETIEVDHIGGWQKLCQNMMGNFARDRKVNFDDIVADALLLAANELEDEYNKNQSAIEKDGEDLSNKPDYPQLLKSFSQLLSGRFPDNMTAANANVSIKLFDHVNTMAETLDLENNLSDLLDGSWFAKTSQLGRIRQELAMKGLEEWNKLPKGSLTMRDINNHSIEALCLELPKIKRITEVMNPLRIDESLVSDLMDI